MDYIKLLRVKHYIKNLLIFVPLMFSGMLFDGDNLLKTFIGFICFCLVASSIYIINDIRDRKKDKQHKTKCNRPIASGKVSVKQAIILVLLLLISTILITILSNMNIYSIMFLVLYFVINLAYSFGLKNVPLLDVAIIALGFLFRVMYGASILNIEVSNWLYLTVLFASFYLALGKRRNEIIKNGKDARTVLKYYNSEFLDKNMYMCLSIAIIFYSLWATDVGAERSGGNLLIWTIPIVMLLCMKYSMDVEGNSDGDPVEVILKDKTIIVLGLILMIVLFGILYF